MKVTISDEDLGGLMYVQLAEEIADGQVAKTEEVASGVNLDLAYDGRVLGVEILYLDKTGDRESGGLDIIASARGEGTIDPAIDDAHTQPHNSIALYKAKYDGEPLEACQFRLFREADKSTTSAANRPLARRRLPGTSCVCPRIPPMGIARLVIRVGCAEDAASGSPG